VVRVTSWWPPIADCFQLRDLASYAQSVGITLSLLLDVAGRAEAFLPISLALTVQGNVAAYARCRLAAQRYSFRPSAPCFRTASSTRYSFSGSTWHPPRGFRSAGADGKSQALNAREYRGVSRLRATRC
jgi:hypothetical protein